MVSVGDGQELVVWRREDVNKVDWVPIYHIRGDVLVGDLVVDSLPFKDEDDKKKVLEDGGGNGMILEEGGNVTNPTNEMMNLLQNNVSFPFYSISFIPSSSQSLDNYKNYGTMEDEEREEENVNENSSSNENKKLLFSVCGGDNSIQLWSISSSSSIKSSSSKINKNENEEMDDPPPSSSSNCCQYLVQKEFEERQAHNQDVNCVKWNYDQSETTTRSSNDESQTIKTESQNMRIQSHLLTSCSDDGFVKLWKLT